MTTEINAALVFADRKKRKMSRVNYALLVGLSKNKIMNIEQGRDIRDEEIEQLRPFIYGEGGAGLDNRDFTHGADVVIPVGQEGLQPIEVLTSPDVYILNQSRPPIILIDDNEIEENDEFMWTDGADDLVTYTYTDLDGNLRNADDELIEDDDGAPLPPEPGFDEWSKGIDAINDRADEEYVDPATGEATSFLFADGTPKNIALFIDQPTEIVELAKEADGVPVVLREKYEFKLEGYHLSNSELQTFKRCHRKWWLTYYRELRLKRPERTGPRAIGTRGHIALSAYYAEPPQNLWEVFDATVEVDRAALVDDPEKLVVLEKEIELCRIMLQGYLEWLEETGADDGLEVAGNEEVVEVKFADVDGVPVVLVGKLDLRVKREGDNLRLFEDHKFIQSLEIPTLHIDEQLLQYQLLEYLEYLEKQTGEFAVGGLYNMLRKVKRTAAAKPPFYARVEVRHNIDELRSYWMRVYGEATDILALRTKLDAGVDPRQVAYPSPRRDCSWDCDFFAVCPMFDDGSAAEAMLGEYYEAHDVHDHYYVESSSDEKTE
jgi:hypothetical protein